MNDLDISFTDRFLPAPKNGGFRHDTWTVWCGSVIKGEDNRYHMFVSCWPAEGPSWILNSQIARASSDTPEGPYKLEEVVLPARGKQYWDGMMTHNPAIQKCGDTYLLFYTGTTFNDSTFNIKNETEGWRNKRIGLATSKSVFGPWKRNDRPILDVRPGKWDSVITSNAAPCVHPDGSVLLVYKSSPSGYKTDLTFEMDLRLGVAWADHYKGPYRRLTDDEILKFPGKKFDLEDPYIWKSKDGYYHMLVKVFDAGIKLIGEENGGLHAISKDGVDWKLASNPLGYSRTVRWDDGSVATLAQLERVQALLEDGEPTHLFFAARQGSGPNGPGTKSWNLVIPLKKE